MPTHAYDLARRWFRLRPACGADQSNPYNGANRSTKVGITSTIDRIMRICAAPNGSSLRLPRLHAC